ncbi:putative lipoprotein YiaD precursor [compost metagenome]
MGLKDRDLTAGEYTSKGAFVRLRFKFDETALGFASAGAVAKLVADEPVAALPPGKITLQADALFESGQHALKPAAHAVLDEVVSRIKSEHYDVVEIIGSATPEGSADDVRNLPKQRAEAVAAYLVAQGVSSARVKSERRTDAPSLADRPKPQGGTRKQLLEIEVAA